MKDTKSAQGILEARREDEQAKSAELRTLDDLELALIGGGDDPVDWP